MRILRNYILRESLLPFFFSLLVLTCVFLLGNLIQLANLVINKGIPIAAVGKVFVLYIPVLIGYTLPIACLMSVILNFSRMSSDNEILAIRVNGIYLRKVLTPMLTVGLILSLVSIVLNERIIPYAHHEQRKLFKNLGAENPTAFLEPGMFIHAFKDQILFIHDIKGNHMKNVTIYQPQPDGKPTRTIIAKQGEFTSVPGDTQIKLKLVDGTSDEPDLNNPNNFYKLNFKTFFITLDLMKDKKKIDKKPKSMTLRELQAETDRLGSLFINTDRYTTEFHRKISWSFSPLVFIFLGFPLAVITNKRERTANVVIAILCAALYYLISLGCEALSIKSLGPPMLLMWTPNIIAGISGSILNYKLCVS